MRTFAAPLLVGLLALAVLCAPAAAKTLTVCTEASPDGFDYSLYSANSTADAASEALYNRLVEFEPGTTQLRPALAESWDISADGQTYTFHLRRQVKFHTTPWFTPSRMLNADDVIYSITRQLDRKNPWFLEARQGWYYASALQLDKLIKSISKLDDHTVRIELSRPEAPFLADLAMGFLSVLSAEYADKLVAEKRLQDMNTKPVGTGPFVLRSYTKDAMVRYEANPDYFRGRVKLDKLLFSISPDGATRLQRLKAGECDVSLYPSPLDWEAIRRNPKLKLLTGTPLNTAFIALNAEHPPLQDKRVRQALNLASDKAALVKAIFDGAAMPAGNPFPPSQWSYEEAGKPWPLDPTKARALLAQAGYPNGFAMKLWIRVGAGGANPNPKSTAELLQADWARIGVKLEIVSLEWGELLHRANAGEHDAVLFSWASDNGDPDNFLTPTLSCAGITGGGNASRWCNPAFDQLLASARKSKDQAQRIQFYQRAQKIFRDEAPWVALVYPVMAVALSNKVIGMKISPLTLNNYADVDVEAR